MVAVIKVHKTSLGVVLSSSHLKLDEREEESELGLGVVLSSSHLKR